MIERLPLAKVENEKRRWLILKHLSEMEGRALASEMLAPALTAWGVPTTVDQVKIAAHWLSEQGFVEVDRIGRLEIVRLLGQGREVITRHLDVPGLFAIDSGY